METRSPFLHVAFGTDARSLSIRGPDGPVLASLRGIFAGARRPTAGLDGPADLTVSETGDGFELRAHTDPEVRRFDSAAELVGALEFGVAHFLLGALRDRTHLHAAGAVSATSRTPAAVLALGPSGSGKSSLALAWSRRGLPLLGDDVVLADATGAPAPFRRPLRVDAELLP